MHKAFCYQIRQVNIGHAQNYFDIKIDRRYQILMSQLMMSYSTLLKKFLISNFFLVLSKEKTKRSKKLKTICRYRKY